MPSKYFSAQSIPLLCVVLLLLYSLLNGSKISTMLEGFELYSSANNLQTLTIKQLGKAVTSYDLPTSDMFDRSGKRQLNFRYVSKERWLKLSRTLPDSVFFINGQKVVASFEHYATSLSLAIILDKKKLYLVAPPHAEQFANILQYERRYRPDVMACHGGDSFCQSTKILALGAVSGLKDRILKEDTVGSFFAPMGRWVSDELDVKIVSKQAQEAVITGTMMVPFNEQRIAIKNPQGALYQIIKTAPSEYPDDPRYLIPFAFKIKLPLNQGETVLRVLFEKVTKNSRDSLIPKFSGILTRLEISPVSR